MAEGELKTLLKVCLWATACMSYARIVSSKSPPGAARLAAILPVLLLLPIIPWSFSSIQLRAISFFFLTWLALFKLVLLALGLGPLYPSLPLPAFVSFASLPIKTRDKSSPSPPLRPANLLLGIFFKAASVFALCTLYQYKPVMHPYLLLLVYFLHISIALDFMLSAAALFAVAVIGLDVEPPFNSPFSATSLEDFWGRRWNLMVTGILRLTVYNPVRAHLGPLAGVLATFFVSGIMHELLAYYFTSENPTWEATSYFLLHGFCLVAEKWVKRNTHMRLNPVVGWVFTQGFMMMTSFCLLFRPILRSTAEERLVEESEAVVRFVTESARALFV